MRGDMSGLMRVKQKCPLRDNVMLSTSRIFLVVSIVFRYVFHSSRAISFGE